MEKTGENGKISLTQISIPSSVSSFGDGAFYGYSLLKQITFENPSSVTLIRIYYFATCSSLTQISIPPSKISITINHYQNIYENILFLNSFVNYLYGIKLTDEYLDKIYKNFKIFSISKFEDTTLINNIKNDTKIIIIDIMEYKNEEYIVICFEKVITLISKSNFHFLQKFFTNHHDSNMITISEEIHEIINLNKYGIVNEKESKEMKETYDYILRNERSRFLLYFMIQYPSDEDMIEIWKELRLIILCFIIKRSYLKINQNRFHHFNEIENENKEIKEINEIKEITLNKHDYIKIKHLGLETSIVELIYHIEFEELFAMKIFNGNENSRLIEREKRNYKILDHPLIPKCYYIGTVNREEFILIEYIKGKSLDKIKELNLKYEDKILIIYEMMNIIKYLHTNKFIYRDLKPNNFVIDENKNLILIDFDRMLIKDEEQYTKDFCSVYYDPRVGEEEIYSYEVDIYSLGLIIYFIIMEKNPPREIYSTNIFDEFGLKYHYISNICSKCICKEICSRPSINEILHIFLKYYSSSIHYLTSKNNIEEGNNTIVHNSFQNYMNDEEQLFQIIQDLEKIKFKNNISKEEEKMILLFLFGANQNDPKAQFNLGLFNLGDIYYGGKYVQRDITKAIHYFSLAANQNNPDAQFSLGFIYYKGEYVKRDINKAIHYFTLAANQNDPAAQFCLGFIYYFSKYVQKDITKGIHYLSLAANKNYLYAQFILGNIYFNNQDVNRAILYFYLSAEKGFTESNFFMGIFYSQGIIIERNIEKAIHYYFNGSNHGDQYSKNNLGIIFKYHEYKRNPIEYFEEAIRQKNDSVSMYNLGHIYFYGEKVDKNLDKSIELLIKSSTRNFEPSKILLILVLINKLRVKNITKETIKKEITKYTNESDQLTKEIYNIYLYNNMNIETIYNYLYELYKKIDFTYDIDYHPIESTYFFEKRERELEQKSKKNKNIQQINKHFYEGFGSDLL
ncbi:hypothetical protein M9Y10_024980 [Tritrichomonas musculus]|uniref:Protein kinase domain-containing protein n=1 Tax=Tritrichomonas musculus TaxID=1915356 RepID=A0ABR2HBR8_9EUKA